MKNLYLGITMILVASHESYYGLTSLEFFKPHPISQLAMTGLFVVKVAFFLALTHFLIRYSKMERLVNPDLPISKIIVVASVAILLVNSPLNTPFSPLGQFAALIRDVAQVSIFFSLVSIYISAKLNTKAIG